MKLNVKMCEILNLWECGVGVVLYKVSLWWSFFRVSGVILGWGLGVGESNNNGIDVGRDDLSNLLILIWIVWFEVDLMSVGIEVVFESIVCI